MVTLLMHPRQRPSQAPTGKGTRLINTKAKPEGNLSDRSILDFIWKLYHLSFFMCTENK